jgi:hypothetical protein
MQSTPALYNVSSFLERRISDFFKTLRDSSFLNISQLFFRQGLLKVFVKSSQWVRGQATQSCSESNTSVSACCRVVLGQRLRVQTCHWLKKQTRGSIPNAFEEALTV